MGLFGKKIIKPKYRIQRYERADRRIWFEVQESEEEFYFKVKSGKFDTFEDAKIRITALQKEDADMEIIKSETVYP